MTACARSGAPRAEDLFVGYASLARDADTEDQLRHEFERCRADHAGGRGITIGTLLALANDAGADFSRWKSATGCALAGDSPRPVIVPGIMHPSHALRAMNEHYFVAERDGETSIFRVEEDGSLTAFSLESLTLKFANTFVAGE